MNVPKNLRYTKSHEWVRIDGNTAVVGVTDHAQNELTDVVYVEVPGRGARVEAGKQCAVVESVKAASDIYAPVSGDVAAVNEDLANAPGRSIRIPMAKGGCSPSRSATRGDLNDLLSPDDYAHHIGA